MEVEELAEVANYPSIEVLHTVKKPIEQVEQETPDFFTNSIGRNRA